MGCWVLPGWQFSKSTRVFLKQGHVTEVVAVRISVVDPKSSIHIPKNISWDILYLGCSQIVRDRLAISTTITEQMPVRCYCDMLHEMCANADTVSIWMANTLV